MNRSLHRAAALALVLGFSAHANAMQFSNKLLATGGVSTIEGAAGGGLAPWR